MAIFFEPPERGWTPIPNELIHTTELSPVARLVLMHALSNRADWEEPAWRIAEVLGLSRERVTNALGELKKTGHARKTSTITTPGRPPVQRWDFAWPAFVEGRPQSRVLPSSENPTLAEDAQVSPKVGFSRSGETRLREERDARTRAYLPKSDFPSSENPTPLQDSLPKEVEQDQKEHSDKPQPEPALEEPEPMAMIDFNDYDLPVQTTPPKKSRASKPTEDPDFDKAWDLYGNKADKVQAKKAWFRARKTASAEEILAAIPAYVAVTAGRGEPEGRGSSWKPRRKNMSTWLNNLGWTEEIEPPAKGYQGRAGSDVRTQEGAIERAKARPIVKLMRSGPMPGDLAANRAWYYHWNVQEQRDWTVEQMLETGNSAEDIDWLMDAYANGIDPELYQQFLADYNIPPHGSDS